LWGETEDRGHLWIKEKDWGAPEQCYALGALQILYDDPIAIARNALTDHYAKGSSPKGLGDNWDIEVLELRSRARHPIELGLQNKDHTIFCWNEKVRLAPAIAPSIRVGEPLAPGGAFP